MTLARLRKHQVCAKQATTGLSYVQDVLRPEGLVLEYPTATAALTALSTSICDAFVFDLPALAAAKQAKPDRYGALVGRVGSTEHYGAVLPKGSALRPAVDKAIASLLREGAPRRIAAANFGRAVTSAPVIR
jgi:ABC-type amino acid transport substrate-binding protein